MDIGTADVQQSADKLPSFEQSRDNDQLNQEDKEVSSDSLCVDEHLIIDMEEDPDDVARDPDEVYLQEEEQNEEDYEGDESDEDIRPRRSRRPKHTVNKIDKFGDDNIERVRYFVV